MEDNQKETNWVVSLVFQKMVLGNPSSMQNISNNVSIQKAKTEQEAFGKAYRQANKAPKYKESQLMFDVTIPINETLL